MDNIENILDELNDYEKRKTEEIPKALEEYLNYLARTGDTLFVWSKVKWLLRHKLELVIGSFKEACPTENLPPCPNVEPFHYETMRDKILEQFDSFTCAPFTIQRLCELLCSPRKHYKRTDKFMRGLEKNLLVVSTVDPEQRRPLSSQPLVNGVMEEGVYHHRTPSFSSGKDDRPESAASDVASVSDADSGISDTEDEDKPVKKLGVQEALPQEDEAKQDEQTSDEMMETAGEKDKAATIPTSHSQVPVVSEVPAVPEIPANPADKKDSEEVGAESMKESSEDVKITTLTAEEPAIAEKKTESECVSTELPAESSSSVELGAKVEERPQDETHEEVRECGSDKKRPLEVEDGDEDYSEHHSPDAKQPRIFSPDKPVDSLPATAEPTVDAASAASLSPTPSPSEASCAKVATAEADQVEETAATETQMEAQTEVIPPESKSEEAQE